MTSVCGKGKDKGEGEGKGQGKGKGTEQGKAEARDEKYRCWASKAFLCEGLVVRVAWAQKCFGAQHVQNVAAPLVETARLLSLLVHLASAVGDPRMFASASVYIFMLIMAKCAGSRSKEENLPKKIHLR